MEGPLSHLRRTIKEEEKDMESKEKQMAVLSKKRDDTTAKISKIKAEEKEAQEGIEEADVRLKELKSESRERQKECKSLAKTVSAIGASRTQLCTQRHDALVRCMVEEVALPRLATGKRRRGSGGLRPAGRLHRAHEDRWTAQCCPIHAVAARVHQLDSHFF